MEKTKFFLLPSRLKRFPRKLAFKLLWLSLFNGDIAEVGVYQGGSAKLICEARNENKVLYLFDTFEGLPTPGKFDGSFKKGKYNTSLKYAQDCLRSYKNVYFYQEIFPETASSIENKNFSFVHLDVDIYKSTQDCLEFFYPRMSKGGIILSHDYSSMGRTPVKKAFDEFFTNKPEAIIEFPTSQCMIIKL